MSRLSWLLARIKNRESISISYLSLAPAEEARRGGDRLFADTKQAKVWGIREMALGSASALSETELKEESPSSVGSKAEISASIYRILCTLFSVWQILK